MIPFELTLYSSCKEGKPWVPHIALIYFQDLYILYIGDLISTVPTQLVNQNVLVQMVNSTDRVGRDYLM